MPDCCYTIAATAVEHVPKQFFPIPKDTGLSSSDISTTRQTGIQEYRYNEIARKSGINVPDFRLINGRYFASRRFDIDCEGKRLHTATAGGLLCISLREPFLDYSNLLALTGYVTQSREDVEQMYRRMLFNYLIDNKDASVQEFSVLCSQRFLHRRLVLATCACIRPHAMRRRI